MEKRSYGELSPWRNIIRGDFKHEKLTSADTKVSIYIYIYIAFTYTLCVFIVVIIVINNKFNFK